MKLRTTLVALAALVALAGYVYFIEIPRGEERAAQEEQEKKVIPLDWNRVNEIRIRRYKENVLLQKDGEDWRMLAPVQDLADGFTVQTMLDDLERLESERSFEVDDDAKLSEYRLSKPDVEATISTPDQQRTIYLGTENPVASTRYLRLKDSHTVHIVPGSALTTLSKDIHALRNKRIFRGLNKDDVTSIRVEKEGRRLFTLTRTDDGWSITEPLVAIADEGEVESLLNYLIYLNVKVFYDERPVALDLRGLDPPRITVELAEKEKAWPLLLLGRITDDDQDVYAKRADRDPVLLLNASATERVTPSLYELRQKKIFPDGTDEVAWIELQTPAGSVTLQRSDEGWVLPRLDGRKADPFRVDDVLQVLRDLKALEFFENVDNVEPLGLDDPQMKIRVAHENEKILADLVIGADRGEDKVYAARLPDFQVMSLDKGALDKLPGSDEELLPTDTAEGTEMDADDAGQDGAPQ